MLALVCCIPLLMGCGHHVVFTMGDADEVLFRIGSRSGTAQEVRALTRSMTAAYEEAYGPEIWEADASLSSSILSEALSQLSRVKALCLYADKEGIALTQEERNALAEDRQEAAGAATEETATAAMTADEAEVEEILRQEYALAEKAYETITAAVDTEISDEEARVARCESLSIPLDETRTAEETRLLAGRILGEVVRGKAMETAAMENGVRYDGEILIQRGQEKSSLEEAAFRLKQGQVSDIMETDDGYRILKGITPFDPQETDRVRQELRQARRDSIFTEVYDRFLQEQDLYVNETAMAALEAEYSPTQGEEE